MTETMQSAKPNSNNGFFADPDPKMFLNVDPDTATVLKKFGSGFSFNKFIKNNLMKSFL